MTRRGLFDVRNLWSRGAAESGAESIPPPLFVEDVHYASVYGRYGDVHINAGPGQDLLYVTFAGDGGVGGNTFWNINGGVGSGNLANGYAGTFTNSYGGNISFTGVERFNVLTGDHEDNLVTGDGDDTINSSIGNDTLNSGKGIDVANGGAGTDKWIADKSFATQAIVLDITQAGSQSYLGTGSISSIESLSLRTGSGADDITTYLDVEGQSNFINTNGGDDRIETGIYARYGQATVNGGEGDDLLVAVFGGEDGNAWGITGGVTSGKLNKGFNGAFTNGYGGDFQFIDVERFDVAATSSPDNVTTGDGADTVLGRDGDDIINSRRGIDVVDGGAGTDKWIADKSFATDAINLDFSGAGPHAYLGTGQVGGIEVINLTTGSGDDTVIVLQQQSNDFVSTRGGADQITLHGFERYGDDTAEGGLGKDRLTIIHEGGIFVGLTGGVTGEDAEGHFGLITNGYGASYTFTGIENFSIYLAGDGDSITTGNGRDLLDGGNGGDTLNAGGGADTLIGGGGADSMNGGAGADLFVYEAVSDSGGDVITGYQAGVDTIDLAAIDAKAGTPGDNKFVFIGSAAFSGPAQLRAFQDGGNTFVQGDVNADGVADFSIQLAGLHTLTEGDFVL